MHPRGQTLGLDSQCCIEDDFVAMAGSAVEKRPSRDGCSEHLFQAQRLGAELNAVTVAGLRFPALVLHRKRLPSTVLAGQTHAGIRFIAADRWTWCFCCSETMELHDVRPPGKSESKRVDRQTADDPQVAP